MTDRPNRLTDAVRWCAVSVAWAAVAGATALIAGLTAGSVALIGFGADSIVDGTASAVLVWRFNAERSGPSHADTVERQAARLVGAVLVLIGLYLAVAAAVALANHPTPKAPRPAPPSRPRRRSSSRSSPERSYGSPSSSAAQRYTEMAC